MTPTRLRDCLDLLGWTQRGLARVLERPEGLVRQWARGAAEIPDDVATWADTLAECHAAHPAPGVGDRGTNHRR